MGGENAGELDWMMLGAGSLLWAWSGIKIRKEARAAAGTFEKGYMHERGGGSHQCRKVEGNGA